MKKYVTLALSLLALVLMLGLSACGFSSDSLEIESISAEILTDGSGATRITIKYFDDMEDPVVFDIPMGQVGPQGEIGPIGNGIAKIEIINEEDVEAGENDHQQTLKIYYTDETMEPTEVIVSDGSSIISAKRVEETNEEGVVIAVYMEVTYSDGRSDRIELPRGERGVGIANVLQGEATPQGRPITFVLDNGMTIGPITIPSGPKGDSVTGITMPEPVYDEFGNQVATKFRFIFSSTDETGSPIVSSELTIPSGVDISGLVSEDVVDENGLKVGTKFHFVKSDGTVTDEITVLDGVGVKEILTELNEHGDTVVKVIMTNGAVSSFVIDAPLSIKNVDGVLKEDGSTDLIIHYTNPLHPDTVINVPKAQGIERVETDETETEYILKFYYSGGGDPTVVNFAKPTAWHSSDRDPGKSDGKIGDYWFNESLCIIWHKEAGGWVEVVDFNDYGDEVSVTFHIDKAQGEAWSGISVNTNSYSVTINVGKSFATIEDEWTIPLVTKEGYRFVGWYTTREPNTAINSPFTDLTPVSGELELYPVWEKIS